MTAACLLADYAPVGCFSLLRREADERVAEHGHFAVDVGHALREVVVSVLRNLRRGVEAVRRTFLISFIMCDLRSADTSSVSSRVARSILIVEVIFNR